MIDRSPATHRGQFFEIDDGSDNDGGGGGGGCDDGDRGKRGEGERDSDDANGSLARAMLKVTAIFFN